MESPPSLPRSSGVLRSKSASIMVKTVLVGLLALALQVPVLMVGQILSGRRAYREQAMGEIGRSWGGAQTVVGPVLVVPYRVQTTVSRQTQVGERVVRSPALETVEGRAFFLPGEFSVAGNLECSSRSRGIFRAPVYVARLQFRGSFQPDPGALNLDQPEFDWSRARLVVLLTDSRGLRRAPDLEFGEAREAFHPGPALFEGWSALAAGVPAAGAGDLARSFSFTLELQGAPRLAIAPVGTSNNVALEGDWPDPSFDGHLLPTWREVLNTGFSARWESSVFGRRYPGQWVEHEGRREVEVQTVASAASGVTLADPVDVYRIVERSLKYSLLFSILVLAVFFLFEVCARVRVHPFQYLLIGSALALFHLGFLALGDFVPLGPAYATAAAASSLLISGYSWSVLRTGSRTSLVASGLAVTYGGLYLILRLQDYALLAGAGALFALLGAIMWCTRRIDWYSFDPRPGVKEGAGVA